MAPNQLVIQLKDDVPAAKLAVAKARAESEIEIALAEKAELAARSEYEAKLEANRMTTSTNPAYSPTNIMRLRTDAEAAYLKVELARHERHLNQLAVNQARAELESYRVLANDGGVVTKVNKQVGEGVQLGEPIVEIVNTDTMRIQGYVNVADVEKIQVGMPVRVTFQIPGDETMQHSDPYLGTLGFIDVSVRNLSEGVYIWAEFDNREGQLREGLTANMVVLTDE